MAYMVEQYTLGQKTRNGILNGNLQAMAIQTVYDTTNEEQNHHNLKQQ